MTLCSSQNTQTDADTLKRGLPVHTMTYKHKTMGTSSRGNIYGVNRVLKSPPKHRDKQTS